MQRGLYTTIHEDYRKTVRRFIQRDVEPHLAAWDAARQTGRTVWRDAAKNGVTGLSIPVEYGGGGQARDYRFRNIVLEELAAVGASALASGFSVQDDIFIHYVADLGTPEQKDRWLRPAAAGDLIGAIAMTEPGTGSDLRGIRTTARRTESGWVVSGSKTFITNGIQADCVIVAVKTDEGPGPLTLMMVETGMPGFSRGRHLDKIGMHAQDTAELFFDDVYVPDDNVIGEVGAGLSHLKDHLPLERLSIAALAVAVADAAIAWALEYTSERHAFGRVIADFQATRFTLAHLQTEADVTRAYVDAAIRAHSVSDLTAIDAAKAKYWSTEVQGRVVDACLQLFGGYGYMAEYPISRAFLDARVQRIFGGTNEIMRDIIGRDMTRSRKPAP